MIPKISAAERSRIINDVLIARTAKRAGGILVTDNLTDFKKIRNFCDVKVISGYKLFFKPCSFRRLNLLLCPGVVSG